MINDIKEPQVVQMSPIPCGRQKPTGDIYFEFLSAEERTKCAEVAMRGEPKELDNCGVAKLAKGEKSTAWGIKGITVEVVGDYKDMKAYAKYKHDRWLEGIVDRLPIWC